MEESEVGVGGGGTSRDPIAQPAPERRTADLIAATLGVALAGLILRIWAARHLPVNADEAISGLMAMDLWRGSPWWIVAGNPYGGTAETLLAAPLLAVFPANDAALRCAYVALWAGAAALLALGARRLVGGPTALLLAGLYWLFSWSQVALSIRAFSGYPAGAVAFAGWLWIQLADADADPLAEAGPRCLARRLALGFLAGLAVWQHPLFLAPLLPGLAMGALRQGRAIAGWVLTVGGGGLAGLAPFLLVNARSGWPALAEPPTPTTWTYAYRVHDILTTGLPRLLGVRLGEATFREGPALWVGGWWGRGLALAVGLLVAAAFVGLLRRPGAPRLLGVTGLASPLVLALFRNSIRNVDGRHEMFFPFLALLAVALALRSWRPRWRPAPWFVAVLPLAWGAVFALPGLRVEAARDWPIARLPAVIAELDAAGVPAVRADHWLAYPLTFATGERIQATELDLVRFPRYENAVRAAGARIAYAFRDDSNERPDMVTAVAADARYRPVTIGPWRLFLPR